jgi:hypothetical protein
MLGFSTQVMYLCAASLSLSFACTVPSANERAARYVQQQYLIIANTDVRSGEISRGLLRDNGRAGGLLGCSGESLGDLVGELLVLDVAGSNNHDP